MKSKLFITMVAIAIVSFTACEKDIIEPVENIPAENNSTLKSSSGTSFYISESILQYFVHYCQRQAGPISTNYPNAEGIISLSDATGACCPTSYMMAAACLAHYKDGSATQYNATGAKLSGVITGFKTFTSGWKSIITARNYCNSTSYDGGWLKGTYLNFSNSQRSSAKAQLETWLANNKFIMVPLSVYTSSYTIVNQNVLFQNTSTNPDLSSTTSSSNYVRTSGGSGHVVLVIRIDKDENSSEGGIVTYIDPLSTTRSTSNRKYVSYKRFLDSMIANNGSYPMTAIELK